MLAAADIGVLLLAGGEARRLPGKLQLDAGDVPMLVRVFRNVSAGRATFISCQGPMAAELARQLPVPMVVDRWPRRGPLAGMLSTMAEMPTPYIFAVAGDAPFVTSGLIDRLAAHWQPGDEAVVPKHGESIEPLAALYDRTAFLRAGMPVLESGRGALRLVIERLAARFVRFDAEDDGPIFTNVNTPADYAAIREVFP